MPLIQENGTGVTDANAYVTEADVDDYFDLRDNTDWNNYAGSNDKEAAIIRATTALDNMYRYQLPGYRTFGRGQTLEWPRTAAYDYEGLLIDTQEIPTEVIQCTCEFAVRELITPNSILNDIERGGASFISSLRAGSVGITYVGGTNNPNIVYQTVDSIMSRLLGPMLATFTGQGVRG
jgi:hypothetical protein